MACIAAFVLAFSSAAEALPLPRRVDTSDILAAGSPFSVALASGNTVLVKRRGDGAGAGDDAAWDANELSFAKRGISFSWLGELLGGMCSSGCAKVAKASGANRVADTTEERFWRVPPPMDTLDPFYPPARGNPYGYRPGGAPIDPPSRRPSLLSSPRAA
ncbi:uncharacterized protein PFL1_01407 [Pseudozyma flocculosa PF-1]|uniref:Uncharacterized protein n=1 Tax=Pseudozyma flocculosa TaxID=84751 RepID=A0A5C3EVJ2_9BASI|nr:uncharacterized protein PFL1_01407 [Pseudozyma flocculosa PF-1]EPQ31221.1 hypothetical protein PFL1_01407 [Pseudozyma flocculosa PF-1]SPO36284.1 uncharacterized protein PSFLO_01755 [Pseudozyma flocculosa]